MQIQKSNHQRGYTLAEVLVAVAVFAIVILAALTVYDRSNRVFRQGVESSNLQQNTRVAFNKLVSDLRMTGFDFDRDGIPTGSTGGVNQYQQPDEQFEYIGPSAITIRGNFDFERENAPCTGAVTDNCDNGREKSYESPQFPVVTTGNDEIVTYALVPDSQTTIPACNPSTNCVEFYADTHIPRKSFPDTGGLDETLVQIPGVDLCMNGCNNPPYTLYRFTLARNATNFTNGQNVTRTPLASNIRSMRFTYFQDAQGLQVLRDINNTTDVSTGSTIRGLGQYKVTSSAPVPQRLVRAKVNSLRVELIGMNERADRDYTDPTETVASVRSFRKYRLETLVAPRNIQKRGMREQAAYPPGPPTNVDVCTGPCGGFFVSWDAPVETAVQGAADQYQILIDEAAATGWACSVPVFSGTSAMVFQTSCGRLDPSKTYKIAVVAVNDFGSAMSVAPYDTAQPLNATRAAAPVLVSASTDQNGQVTLTWNRPTTNVVSGTACPGAPTDINPAELLGYKVERRTNIGGTPGPWAMVGTGDVTMNSPHDVVTWADTTAVNCVPYQYRVTLIEQCALNAAYNVGGNLSLGSSAASNVMAGEAVATAPPKKTIDVAITSQNMTGATGDAVLTWPRVHEDTDDAPINVGDYRVYRRKLGETTWTAMIPVTADPAAETITYTDAAVPLLDVDGVTPIAYQYTVTAVQACSPELESEEFTPYRLWPCVFPTGLIGSPPFSVMGQFAGDGSAGNPYLVPAGPDINVTLNVLNPAQIQQVEARVHASDGTLVHTFAPISSAPFAWTWDGEAGATEQLVVTIVDMNGCTTVRSTYVADAAQSCCLVPASFDPTVMTFVAGNTFVDLFLKNVCNEQLNLHGIGVINIVWTSPGGGARIDNVSFPNISGTRTQVPLSSNNSPLQFTIPTSSSPAIAPVPAGSSTYRVRVNFNRNLSFNPITAFSVQYRRPSVLATEAACPIVP